MERSCGCFGKLDGIVGLGHVGLSVARRAGASGRGTSAVGLMPNEWMIMGVGTNNTVYIPKTTLPAVAVR